MTWKHSFSSICLSDGVAGAWKHGFLSHHGSTILQVLCYQWLNTKGMQLRVFRAPSFRDKISLTGPGPVNVLVSVLIFPL